MTEVASERERQEAQARLRGLVWDELQRVVTAIRVENALGVQPALVIRFDRHGGDGPRLILDEEELSGLALAKLSELAGQNLELELVAGKLELSSVSWPPDRLPF